MVHHDSQTQYRWNRNIEQIESNALTPALTPALTHALTPALTPALSLRLDSTLTPPFSLFVVAQTILRKSLSGAKFDEEADFDVRSAVGPPKPHQIDEI